VLGAAQNYLIDESGKIISHLVTSPVLFCFYLINETDLKNRECRQPIYGLRFFGLFPLGCEKFRDRDQLVAALSDSLDQGRDGSKSACLDLMQQDDRSRPQV
jgi:hypothetical protein